LLSDRLQGVRRGLEDVGGGPVGDRRTRALVRLQLTEVLQLAVRDAHREGLSPLVPTVADIDDQPAREGVDHRDADAVQTAGDLVATAAELAAGVEHGQDRRHRRQLLPGGGVGGDAAAVVVDADAAIREEGEHDPVAVAGQ
jgi:hypothetical protein